MEDAAAQPAATAHAVTRLLQGWNSGDAAAQADLMTLVYDELRRLARSWRNVKPETPAPTPNSAQVEGSGTWKARN